MIQPINGRLLVQISGQYKHVNLTGGQQHQLSSSAGVVLSVAPDLAQIIRNVFKLEGDAWPAGLITAEQLVGKTVRWEKYADQNALLELDDPANNGQKIKCALIEYKDITSYEN